MMGERAADGTHTPPGNRAPHEVYEALQALADAGHIKMRTAWCSEIGSFDADGPGHFHGSGAVHLPEVFEMVPAPGEGVECEMPPPYEFRLPIAAPKTGRPE